MKLHMWAKRTSQVIATQSVEDRHRHFTVGDVETILRSAIDALATDLAAGEDLHIESLGRLWVEVKSPRVFANNLGGKTQRVKLKARQTVRFRPSATLLRRLNTPGQDDT